MPMIDVYAAAGTFADEHQLAQDLATAVMTIEQVPDIPLFRTNTAAFVHDLPEDSLANVDGDLEREPVRIRDFYTVKSHRIEPLGLVYLWPA